MKYTWHKEEGKMSGTIKMSRDVLNFVGTFESEAKKRGYRLCRILDEDSSYESGNTREVFYFFKRGWEAAMKEAYNRPDPLDEAYNMGDGVYRP